MSCRSSLSFIGRHLCSSMTRTSRPMVPTAGAKLGGVESESARPSDPSCFASPELIEFLQSLGATPQQIADAQPSGLTGLGADLVFAAAEGLTAFEVAARAGT